MKLVDVTSSTNLAFNIEKLTQILDLKLETM